MSNLERTDSRRDLSKFLLARRTRTRPEDVGLTTGARRRTPGLLREEVAQLAGVGVTWYTCFEQGQTFAYRRIFSRAPVERYV